MYIVSEKDNNDIHVMFVYGNIEMLKKSYTSYGMTKQHMFNADFVIKHSTDFSYATIIKDRTGTLHEVAFSMEIVLQMIKDHYESAKY